jgi:hypothetical protein
MSLTELEFASLRQTIAIRGTLRIVMLPMTLLAWGAGGITLLLWSHQPLAAVFSLATLVGGFEAIYALHTGVERIGRYLQVFCETSSQGPRWESTAMTMGPALPGGGVDPLFTVVFLGATTANLLPAVVPGPTTWELATLLVLHFAFVVRVVRARAAAMRQRAVELESYRALKSDDDN